MKSLAVILSGILFVTGCSLYESPCEDVTFAAEQAQQCQALHKQIINAKDRPVIRTELERRYQQDCVEIRYYRDDKQAAVCQNKAATGAMREEK